MKPRLSRPLLAALVSGALVAGGAIYTSPASAGTPLAAAPVAEESEAPPSVAPPSEAPPSVAPPSEEPPSQAPPSVAPPSEVPPSVAPPSVAPPSTNPSSNPSTPNTKPTGAFTLSLSSLWIGQVLTFQQTALADDGGAANVTRTISWGDGTRTTLAAGVNTAKKAYSRAGTYTVTYELTDQGGLKTTLTKKVSVVVPGKFSLSKSSAYQGVPFNVNISRLPAGTTRVVINWADGYVTGHPAKNGAVSGYILYRKGTKSKLSGSFKITVQLDNKNGRSAPINAGTIRILRDAYKPVLKITKPSSPSKVSSWKTVRGTLTDKGSGAPYVWVTALRTTKSNKSYCLTPKRKWKRVYTFDQYWDNCASGEKGVRIKVSKGKWSLKLPSGLTKGEIAVEAWTWDWSDNLSQKYREAKLTR